MLPLLFAIALLDYSLIAEPTAEVVLSTLDSLRGGILLFLLCAIAVFFLSVGMRVLAADELRTLLGKAACTTVPIALAFASYSAGAPAWKGLDLLVLGLIPWLDRIVSEPAARLIKARPARCLVTGAIAVMLVSFASVEIGLTLGTLPSLFLVLSIVAILLTSMGLLDATRRVFWGAIALATTSLVFYRAAPIRLLQDPTLFAMAADAGCNKPGPAGMVTVEEAFDCWYETNKDAGGQATMFLLATAGGGIRAAE